MYEVECAYRRENGGFVFVHETQINEAIDDLCDLRVRFAITAIYPAEPDIGAGMDWNGDIASIEIRTMGWRKWRILRDSEFDAAKAFLLKEYGRELWQAGDNYAEAVHYGEVAA
jgi:hypothetical protein